jgi:ATP-binding protein involved in chromosome partitioning
MLHKALQQFLSDVYWGELDVLLLDLPPGTGDITLSLLELLPDAALLPVTTPQLAARTVASRVARMAREADMPVAGVVENMTAAVCAGCGTTTALFGSGGGATLAEQTGAPLLGQIPLDIELRDAGDRGVPVVAASPTAASAVELTRIAGSLPTARRSLFRRPLPLFVSTAGPADAARVARHRRPAQVNSPYGKPRCAADRPSRTRCDPRRRISVQPSRLSAARTRAALGM